ncbi:hypothetical protein BpHYR1_048589 [Brachionus plicatilis]|uniref:Uncharacterized protein n=1 Tax=Brachionus plicatilis TaxID=10195 RepID=A0A3M7RVI7_BRAPC|nr:hypothetical protein BpHYR1_048589 [Brachionus plicatilis]
MVEDDAVSLLNGSSSSSSTRTTSGILLALIVVIGSLVSGLVWPPGTGLCSVHLRATAAEHLAIVFVIQVELGAAKFPFQLLDEIQGLLSFVAHQTNSARVHHLEELFQIDNAHFGIVLKVGVQIGAQFVLLFLDVAKRVHLACFALWLEAAYDQIAVLEKATADYFLRPPGGYQLVIQMVLGLAKIAVQGLGAHTRKHMLAHGCARALLTIVVLQQGVQVDLKCVHAELELALHFVHKLELNVLALVHPSELFLVGRTVARGYVLVEAVKHSFLDQIANVGEPQVGTQVGVGVAGQIQQIACEYDVYVRILEQIVLGKHKAGHAAIYPDVLEVDSFVEQIFKIACHWEIRINWQRERLRKPRTLRASFS